MRGSGSKKVLVTGGTGFVGSHLVELLVQKGYDVTCVVRDPVRLRWIKGLDVRIVQGDCSLPETLVPAVKDVSVVIHAAGLTKAKRAKDYYEVNHLGTKNVLEACARYNPEIDKFILVSSLAAAGPSPDGTPVKDTDAPRPVSDYGMSKVLAERETLGFKNAFPVVILRPSAVYGPRDTDMFELFRWAAKGLTMEISGGERFINPCFVGDLATALLRAAENATPSGNIYFVAENRRYSWAEFWQTLLATGGVRARRVTVPYPAAYLIGLAWEIGGLITGRPPITNRQKVREAAEKYWICDVTKIERDLNFTAGHPLQKGLEVTWTWYRQNGWL